jgi:hypothetical protein
MIYIHAESSMGFSHQKTDPWDSKPTHPKMPCLFRSHVVFQTMKFTPSKFITVDSMPNFQKPANMPNFHQFSMVSMGFSSIFTKFPIDLWDSMAKWLVSTHQKFGLFLHCRSSKVLVERTFFSLDEKSFPQMHIMLKRMYYNILRMYNMI